MIKIKIDNPDKLASNVLIKKSAFVSFDYDGRIVDFIKKWVLEFIMLIIVLGKCLSII